MPDWTHSPAPDQRLHILTIEDNPSVVASNVRPHHAIEIIRRHNALQHPNPAELHRLRAALDACQPLHDAAHALHAQTRSTVVHTATIARDLHHAIAHLRRYIEAAEYVTPTDSTSPPIEPQTPAGANLHSHVPINTSFPS